MRDSPSEMTNLQQGTPGTRRWPDVLLALLVLALWLVQWRFSYVYKEQLALEDAGESLRSPFWLLHRTVINGIASNVGYYATVAWAYSLFGYSVTMAKWVRLGLHLFSLATWALLLRRWMGPLRSLLPLLVAGLSPSWLYFNTNQASFGIDLQYAPFLFLLAAFLTDARGWHVLAWAFLLGFIWIWDALNFPTALFYLPPLALFVAWGRGRKNGWTNLRAHFGTAAAFGFGALTPIAGFLLYAKAPMLLIYDPYVKAGVFRGGGGGFTRRIGVIAQHYATVFGDLFIRSDSHSLYLPNSEFGNWPSRIGFLLVLSGVLALLWRERSRLSSLAALHERPKLALLVWLLFFAAFLFGFPQFVATFPGLRRIAGFLVAFYGLAAFLWTHALDEPAPARHPRLPFAAAALACLFAGNAWSLYRNLESGPMKAASINWFSVKPTVEESLEYWERKTRDGEPLRCETFDSTTCRYQEIFPAIQGYRHWNRLPPHEVLGWDPLKKVVRPIELSIWETNEWPRW